MGAFIHRKGLTTTDNIMKTLYEDLIGNGFDPILPESGPFNPGVGNTKFVVESTAAVNPVNARQAYRIMMERGGNSGTGPDLDCLKVIIANPQQITDLGAVTSRPTMSDPSIPDNLYMQQVMGHLGSQYKPNSFPNTYTTGTSTDPQNIPGPSTKPKDDAVFLNRGIDDVTSTRNGTSGTSYTVRSTHNTYVENTGIAYSYVLSISDHGVAFFLWEDSTEPAPIFSMFCVQTPVDKDTGQPLLDLKSPIFCIYNCNNTGYKKFVVSEEDVAAPTVSVSAGQDSLNSAAILNEEEQVSVKINSRYLITFPNRVNTERYAYAEELDMIAYASADVIGEDTLIPITVYGEEVPRKYRAMKSTGPNNTKMRLLLLQEGGGIPPVTQG